MPHIQHTTSEAWPDEQWEAFLSSLQQLLAGCEHLISNGPDQQEPDLSSQSAVFSLWSDPWRSVTILRSGPVALHGVHHTSHHYPEPGTPHAELTLAALLLALNFPTRQTLKVDDAFQNDYLRAHRRVKALHPATPFRAHEHVVSREHFTTPAGWTGQL